MKLVILMAHFSNLLLKASHKEVCVYIIYAVLVLFSEAFIAISHPGRLIKS